MRNHLALWVAASLLAPSAVLAQGRPIGLNERAQGRDYALELELDVSSVGEPAPGDAQFTEIVPKIYGSFGLTENLELEATLPATFADYAPGDPDREERSAFVVGNPYLALFYAQRTEHSVGRIGLGVAAPLVQDNHDFDTMAVFNTMVARGLAEPWQWLPERVSLVLPGQVQLRMSALVLGADGALSIAIPTSGAEDQDTEVLGQLGAIVGAAVGDVTLGLRLQAAGLLTGDAGDALQTSVMPFAQADFSGGAFVHGGVLVALDDPYGVLGDNGVGMWAVRVGGGARF